MATPDNYRVGLAFLDRKKYQTLIQGKKNKKPETQKSPWPSFKKRLFKKLMDIYLAKQSYTHCEICFWDADLPGTKIKAFTALEHEGVTMMRREFNNNAYTWIHLQVTVKEYGQLFEFCKTQTTKKYDARSTGICFPIWPYECNGLENGGEFTCSSFVHAALRHIGILKCFDLNRLDTDDIYMLIDDCPDLKCEGITPKELNSLKL